MELVETTNVVQGHRVTEFIRLVHGHGRDHAGHETNELRRQLVGRRTGLARRHQAINRLVDIVRGTVALRDGLEGRHDGRHLFDIEHADWIHVAAEEQLVAGILDLLDDVCADALATVRDRRVSGRQVDVVRGRRTQDVQKFIGQAKRILGNTRVDRGLEGVLRPHVVVKGHVGRIHRILGCTHQRHVVEGIATIVRDGRIQAFEVLRRLTRIDVIHRASQARIGQQGEGLERRARHRDVLRDRILLTLVEIRTRVLSEDLTSGRVHGGQCDVLILGIPATDLVHGLGGLDGLILVVLDDRRGDAQAALADLVLIELAGGQQLGLNLCHQVAIGAGHGFAVERVGVNRLGEHRRIPLGLRDPAVLHHEIQVALPALLRLPGADGGVPRGGCGNNRSDQRGLGQGQVGCTMAEVGLRSSVDAVGTTTEVDRVHVGTDDLVLGLFTVDLEREHGFLELATVGIRGLTDEVSLNVLLSEGRCTLPCSAAQIVDERAEDTLDVNAGVRVERAVLGGDDRLGHVVGKLGRVDDLPIDLAEATHLGRAVRVVDGRLLRERQVSRRGHAERVVQVQKHGHADDKKSQEDGQDSKADALGPAETLLLGTLLVTRRGRGGLRR